MVVRGNKRVSGKRESANKRREWEGANDGESTNSVPRVSSAFCTLWTPRAVT